MDATEVLLRRIALNDENTLERVLTRQPAGGGQITPELEWHVRLAAMLAVGAATPSLREAVAQASGAGATSEAIVGVLVAIGPVIGLAGLVAAAQKLALAIGYDLENGEAAHLPLSSVGPRLTPG